MRLAEAQRKAARVYPQLSAGHTETARSGGLTSTTSPFTRSTMAAARAWSVNTASTSSARMAVQGMEAWSASSGFWTSESQCPAAQDPSQAALGHRATVEDHGDRRRNVTWQQGKEEAQRFDTARGCPDRDDVATNPFGID